MKSGDIVLIETRHDNGVEWGVSLDGPNPEPTDYINCHKRKTLAVSICRFLKAQAKTKERERAMKATKKQIIEKLAKDLADGLWNPKVGLDDGPLYDLGEALMKNPNLFEGKAEIITAIKRKIGELNN